MINRAAMLAPGLALSLLFAAAQGAAAKVIDFVSGAPGDYVPHPIYDAPERVGSVAQSYCLSDEAFCRSKDGFSFQLSFYEDHPGISLDDDGIVASYAYRDDFGRFSVRSLDLLSISPGGGAYVTGSGPAPTGNDYSAYDAWLKEGGHYQGIAYGIYGYRNGMRVGSYEFGVDVGVPDQNRIKLGAGFSNIDAIKFAMVLPWDQMYGEMNWLDADRYGQVPPSNALTCLSEYCDAFSVKSMKVSLLAPAPVPLPASGVLLGGVLAIGAFAARKRLRGNATGNATV